MVELTGDASWSPGPMRAYFERLENCRYDHPNPLNLLSDRLRRYVKPAQHGKAGWLSVERAPINLLFRDSALERILMCGRYQKFDRQGPAPTLTSNEPEFGGRVLTGALDALRQIGTGQGVVDPVARRLGLSYDFLPPNFGDHVPDRYLHALSP